MQEVSLRISTSDNFVAGLSNLMMQITNSTMQVSVIQNNNSYTIPYSIYSKDTTKNQFKI